MTTRLHRHQRDDHPALTRDASVEHAAEQDRLRTDGVQRQQHRQNVGERQRVDIERHLLVQPDARHGHRAHVGQVRDRDGDATGSRPPGPG